MIKFLLIIFFELVHNFANAEVENCEVQFYPKIYFVNILQIKFQDLVKKSTCKKEINQNIVKIFTEFNGTVSSNYIKLRLVNNKNDTFLNISPNKIELQNINEVIASTFNKNSNFNIKNIKPTNFNQSISLNENDELILTCRDCDTFGTKNIQIKSNNENNNIVWVNATFQKQVKVFVAKKSLENKTEKNIDAIDIEEKTILTEEADIYFSDLENIKFYGLNKIIQKGEPLKKSDLNLKNLVQFGTPVQVSLSSNNLSLQKTFMPTRSGKLNETIEFKNNNNKSIYGKIVDYNKAIIEL